MPQVTTEEHKGFTKRISRNDIAPKDGSAPLTVIEFSLTNEVRDSLKAAIDAYRKDPENEQKLAQIIKDHFPPEILEELGALAKEKGTPATVYIVHNLPKDRITQRLLQSEMSLEVKQELENYIEGSYTNLLSRGIGSALTLEHMETFHFTKKVGSLTAEEDTGKLHKHAEPITMLGGVLTGGSQTRFVDVGALIEDAEAQGIHVQVGEDMEKPVSPSLLSGLNKDAPGWQELKGYEIIPDDTISSKTASKANARKFEALVDKHSQRTIIGSGDLALWAEDGRLYHQSLPGKEKGKIRGWLGRLAIGHAFNRSENER